MSHPRNKQWRQAALTPLSEHLRWKRKRGRPLSGAAPACASFTCSSPVLSIAPRIARKIAPDPADDPFCACAEEGAADFLVTLNQRDFPAAALSAKVLAPGSPLPSGRIFKHR